MHLCIYSAIITLFYFISFFFLFLVISLAYFDIDIRKHQLSSTS